MRYPAALFLILSAFLSIAAYAGDSPWKKGGFDGYINGDGSSLDEAIIIKVPGLSDCNYSRQCEIEGFKQISGQEYAYLEKRFGQEGSGWKLEGADNWQVDIENNDKLYDKVAIRLAADQEQVVLYFDITEPVLTLSGQ